MLSHFNNTKLLLHMVPVPTPTNMFIATLCIECQSRFIIVINLSLRIVYQMLTNMALL